MIVREDQDNFIFITQHDHAYIAGEFLTHFKNATFPYIVELAEKGWKKACLDNYELLKGLNIINGEVVYREVANAFDLHYKPVHHFLDTRGAED